MLWKNETFTLTKKIPSNRLLFTIAYVKTTSSWKFWQEKRQIFHKMHRTFVQNTKLDFCRFMEAFGATRFWTRLFDRCKTRCIGYWVVYLYQMFCNDNQVYYITLHRNPILSKAKSKGMYLRKIHVLNSQYSYTLSLPILNCKRFLIVNLFLGSNHFPFLPIFVTRFKRCWNPADHIFNVTTFANVRNRKNVQKYLDHLGCVFRNYFHDEWWSHVWY